MQHKTLWDQPLSSVDKKIAGAGFLMQYKAVANALYNLIKNADTSTYMILKSAIQKAGGKTDNFHKFFELQNYIAENKDNISLGNCVRIIDGLEQQLYAMWPTASVNDTIQKDPAFVGHPEIKKLLIELNTLKRLLFHEIGVGRTLNQETNLDNIAHITIKHALEHMVKRDADLLIHRMEKFNKKATEKWSDKVKALTSKVNTGMHTNFENIATLLSSGIDFSNEDKLQLFIKKYQEIALAIARGSANKPFLEIIKDMSIELKYFIETHTFLYHPASVTKWVANIQAVENLATEQLQKVEEIKPKNVTDLYNDLMYGRQEHEKDKIKKTGKTYSEKAFLHMRDHSDDFVEVVNKVFTQMRTLAPLQDIVEIKEEAQKGDIFVKGAKKGIGTASDNLLGSVPFVGKALSGAVTWLGEKAVDIGTEKLGERMDRKKIDPETAEKFVMLISNPDALDLNLLSQNFVVHLLATFPDAFNRMRFTSEDDLKRVMEKLTAIMATMLPHFSDELLVAFEKNNTPREKYREMGLILVEALVTGCQDRLILQNLITKWNVPYLVDIHYNTVENVPLFDIFTKCGLIATPSYQQKNELNLQKDEMIVYAPRNNENEQAINVKKYGFRYAPSTHEQFSIGFETSCLRASQKDGNLCETDPRITYQSTLEQLRGTNDPYHYSATASLSQKQEKHAEKTDEPGKKRRNATTISRPTMTIPPVPSPISASSSTTTTMPISTASSSSTSSTSSQAMQDDNLRMLVTNQAQQIQLMQQQLQAQALQMQQIMQLLQQQQSAQPQPSTTIATPTTGSLWQSVKPVKPVKPNAHPNKQENENEKENEKGHSQDPTSRKKS